jgi:hypothetical protein
MMGSESKVKNSDTLEMLTIETLGEKIFNVEYYQRGYRWKKPQVKQLLDDIHSFTPTHKSRFYFLQALVVSEGEAGVWNVVDGQQRLTTIALIQEILGMDNLGKNKISIQSKRGKGALDDHYRGEAKDVIREWFKERPESEKNVFLKKLAGASFLIYRISPEDEQAVFHRLNSGKISAKNSELVKCIMLTPQMDEPLEVTQARAREWDEIDRALTNDQFFSFFVSRNTWGEEDRMTMLFCRAGLCQELEENRTQNEVFPFLTCVQKAISTTSRREVWEKIYFAYYTLVAWYNDPVMYHAVGWLVHRKGSERACKLSITQIQDKMKAEMTKDSAKVHGEPNQEENADQKDFYNDNPQLTRNYLLLHNVAFCWRRWPMRYDFHQHRQVGSWSLEHIVARNERKLTEAEFSKFAPLVIKEEDWENYVAACNNNTSDSWLADKLDDSYPKEDDHNIRNLALIGTSANASLNNKLFNGKWRQILDWDSEHKYWVPPATQAVFFKTIKGVDPRISYWSQEDKEEYVKAMQEDVTLFIDQVSIGV